MSVGDANFCLRAAAVELASSSAGGLTLEAKMRKVLASLALGCALAVALSVAASACDYGKQATSASADKGQTAQTQPASSDN